MSTTETPTPTLARLEQLRGAAGAQRERVAELDRARQDGARRIEAARSRLLAFYRDREANAWAEPFLDAGDGIIVEEGTDPDVIVVGDPALQSEGLGSSPRESALLAELRNAEGGVTLRAEMIPHGAGLSDVKLTPVDERAEAAYDGAVERLEHLAGELREFVRTHLGELAVERAPRAKAVSDQAAEALRVAAAAMASYEGERSWWASVLALTVGDGETAVVDVPANPLAGLQQGVRVRVPLPERFT